MNELLKNAFDIADRMEVLSNQKSLLREEFNQTLQFYTEGGSFTSSKDLIVFVKTLIDLNNSVDVVIIDNNDTPIQIPDLKEFLKEITNCYFSATNAYYTKYNKLVTRRSIKGLILNDK